MKLLENPKFDAVMSVLCTEIAKDRHLDVRLESYSCKMAGNDKRLLKLMSQEGGGSPGSLVPLASPEQNLSRSPYARSAGSDQGNSLITITDAVSVKTLSYLIGILNAGFKPDYEFSSAKSSEFFRQPNLEVVMSSVNSELSASLGDHNHLSANQLWNVIDEEINLQESEVYSYHPDFASDPFSEAVWSFNYFFFNKRLKRIVFLCCRCLVPEHKLANDNVDYELCDFDLDYDLDDADTKMSTGGSEDSCLYPSITV